MKKILILSDGRPGHFNQSQAVVDAIKKLDEVELTYINIKIRRLGKYLLRIILNSNKARELFRGKFSLKTIKIFYKGYEWTEQPDIIISAGKDTSFLNSVLALMHGSKNIFIGNPKKLDNYLFTTILTVLDLGLDNQIVLDVAPTRIYDGDLTAFAKSYNIDTEYIYATLLIGGNGSGYEYSEKDIDELISFVNATVGKIKWLVTTSRRTFMEYEKKMDKRMKADCFIAFNKNPQKVVAGFLELSSIVFVTEESASMVSEGIASCKPVVTLAPKNYSIDKNYLQILNTFQEKQLIRRKDISQLDINILSLDKFVPLKERSVDEIAQKLQESIG